MKMIRRQTNPNWPAVVTAEIKTVSGSEPRNHGHSVCRLVGDTRDAEALAPKREYRTQAATIKAAQKIGWEIK